MVASYRILSSATGSIQQQEQKKQQHWNEQEMRVCESDNKFQKKHHHIRSINSITLLIELKIR
uniref:CSON010886 protein n=1 Tax=Culicoides sonorensis TaxID=179676 RepID=A0A336KIN5_CULSO